MIIRVSEPGRPAFQLRKGEEGISVFIPERVAPPLSDEEILEAFRPGSTLVFRHEDEFAGKGLVIETIEGADLLPDRLRSAHAEIRPALGMSRIEFKAALKELE